MCIDTYVFYIHSSVLGSHKHLLFNEQTRSGSWTEKLDLSVPAYTKSFKESSCFDSILKLSASDASLEFPTEYLNLALNAFSTRSPMWAMMLPNHVFKSAVMNFVNAAIEAKTSLVQEYYNSTWAHVGSFLNKLRPIRVSGVDLGRVTYDRLSTRTGRMIVSSGPQILTMTKDKRKQITGETESPIYYVDFRALEPTIVANIVDARFSGSDLYVWLAENVLRVQTRDAAKKAVVSALYGDQTHRTSDAKLIAQWFDLKNLAVKIRVMSPDQKRVMNIYGRLIASKDMTNDGYVINDYIQSSAVDSAILGFDAICSSLRLAPLAIVHDAMIVEDCHNNLSDGFVSSVVVDRVGTLYYKATRLDS